VYFQGLCHRLLLSIFQKKCCSRLVPSNLLSPLVL
jgi:hypothetical protein